MTEPDVTTARGQGEFVDANGVRTYYEVEGGGEPLVLLHGGLCAIETLAGLRAGLAATTGCTCPSAAAIRHAEVAVVANATHALPMEKPDVVADLVLRFIAEHAATQL